MFTDTVNIEVTQLTNCTKTYNITVTRPNSLTFTASVSGQLYNGVADDTITVNLPYLHLLSSIRATGSVDDNGYISINGTTIFSRWRDGSGYDEPFNTNVLLSIFRAEGNQIRLHAENTTHSTSSNNGTGAHLTLYFTYK